MYDVALPPRHGALQDMVQVRAALKYGELQEMYRSSTMISYLKVYQETMQASDNRHPIEVDKKMFYSSVLLELNPNPVVYLNEEVMRQALQCSFIHVGVFNSLWNKYTSKNMSGTNFYKEAINRAVNIKYEVPRTKGFMEVFTMTELRDQFNFGHIELPNDFKKAYSVFGRSLNDVCIIHKTYYKQHGQVTGGVVLGLEEEHNSEDIDSDRIMTIGTFDNNCSTGGVCTNAGILEFKMEKYNTDRTIKEMLRSAGDLVAKALYEGEKVNQAIMYGLAFNYYTEKAMLIIMILDFTKNTSNVIVSSQPVSLISALNWLLNCITLKQ